MVVLRLVLVAALLFLGSACSIHQPYPQSWPPLRESSISDCRHLNGEYADRGEMIGFEAKPSLTRELFGSDSDWGGAKRVAFSFTAVDTAEVVVFGTTGESFRRTLSSNRGEFRCEAGHAIVRDRRWVAADVVAGMEAVAIELSLADGYLITHVREQAAGLLMLVIPVFARTSSWYRFERLR